MKHLTNSRRNFFNSSQVLGLDDKIRDEVQVPGLLSLAYDPVTTKSQHG